MFDWQREGSCSVHLRGGVCFGPGKKLNSTVPTSLRFYILLLFCFRFHLNQLITERKNFLCVSERIFRRCPDAGVGKDWLQGGF